MGRTRPPHRFNRVDSLVAAAEAHVPAHAAGASTVQNLSPPRMVVNGDERMRMLATESPSCWSAVRAAAGPMRALASVPGKANTPSGGMTWASLRPNSCADTHAAAASSNACTIDAAGAITQQCGPWAA